MKRSLLLTFILFFLFPVAASFSQDVQQKTYTENRL
jgi:hypothetical protein